MKSTKLLYVTSIIGSLLFVTLFCFDAYSMLFGRAISGLPQIMKKGMIFAAVFQFIWMALVIILPAYVNTNYYSKIKKFIILTLVFSGLQIVATASALQRQVFIIPENVAFLLLYLFIFLPMFLLSVRNK